MLPSLRHLLRDARGVAALVLGVALPLAVPVPTEPWPHQYPVHEPSAVATLTSAPAVLHCTVRREVDGCVSFAPDAPGAVVAVLYTQPYFRGTRVVVHLDVGATECSARTSDDEGGGDLGGPLRAALGRIRSVETSHRCDVRLHDEFLGTGGRASGWLHRELVVSAGLPVAAFTIS
ncbi:hypothetical protein ACNHYB_11540 [Isoptericola jiangsuensis]|uniref:hypothetical protein n=1 Tax=Isoptericola jiangsuensis TaxID=548579 RepID=UPI003AAE764C